VILVEIAGTEPVKESKKDKISHPFHGISKFKFNKVVSDNNK